MDTIYDFYIAGRARDKEKILEICAIFDASNVSYYCFLQNEQSHKDAGIDMNSSPEEIAKIFGQLTLESEAIQTFFRHDMEAERQSKNLLLVLPGGKASHIEAGVAYGLGRKCYAVGTCEGIDTLYLIFEEIFANEQELRTFLQNYR